MSKAVSAGNDLDDSRKLVMGFVDYSQRILNEDMKPFFEDHIHLFDQEEDELQDGSGHTLEQYDAFKKYESLLEEKIDEFALEKGFSSSRTCFQAIQEALETDKQAQKNLMNDIQKQFMAMRKALLKRTEATEADSKNDDNNTSSPSTSQLKGESSSSPSKGGEDNDDRSAKGTDSGRKGSDDYESDSKGADHVDSGSKNFRSSKGIDDNADSKGDSGSKNTNDNDEEEAPVMRVPMFFNPLPLERMLESILQLSEYNTFSAIMRNKVKQKKFATELESRMRRQEQDIEEREQQIRQGGKYLESNELFSWLRNRLAGMLPGNEHKQSVHLFMEVEKWDKFVGRDNFDNAEEKLEFKRLCSYTFGHIQRLGLIEDYVLVRQKVMEIMDQADTDDATVPELLTKYLKYAHGLVDQCETQLYNILKAHKVI